MVSVSRSLFHISVVLLILLGSITWCTKQDDVTETSTSTLVRALNSYPDSFDYQQYRGSDAGDVLRDTGEGLIAYDDDGNLVGGVAESWSVSQSGLIYTFKIRDEARWSDGSSVDAEDFVFSMRRLIDPQTMSPNASLIFGINNAEQIHKEILEPTELGVSALATDLLEIRLADPVPYFLSILTNPATFPVARSDIESQGVKYPLAGLTLSNGAFRLDGSVAGNRVELSRNHSYWNNSKTYFERVLFKVVDSSAQGLQFRAGELDVAKNIDKSTLITMREKAPNSIRIFPGAGIYYYGFKMQRAPFKNNPSLRKALSLAINRDDIVEVVTGRGEIPAYGLIPPTISNHESLLVDDNLSEELRRARAKAALSEAGYGPANPLKLSLRYPSGSNHDRIATAIQEMWRDVLGAEVSLESEEFRVYLSSLSDDPSIDIFWLSWLGQFDDATAFLQIFRTDSENNYTDFSSSEFDREYQRAQAESDIAGRSKILVGAESIVMEESPIIPIYFYVNKFLVRDGIQGFQPNLFGHFYSKDLSIRK